MRQVLPRSPADSRHPVEDQAEVRQVGRIAQHIHIVNHPHRRYRRRQRLYVEMEQMASRPFGQVEWSGWRDFRSDLTCAGADRVREDPRHHREQPAPQQEAAEEIPAQPHRAGALRREPGGRALPHCQDAHRGTQVLQSTVMYCTALH